MEEENGPFLTPCNCVVVLLDYQENPVKAITSSNPEALANNLLLLAKTAKVFNVPAILTSLAAENYGEIRPELLAVFPEHSRIERSSLSAWADPEFGAKLKCLARKKFLLAGLWTDGSLLLSALHAITLGFEVYLVEDACVGTSALSHDAAVRRMERAGVISVTAAQLLCEFQGDCARKETFEAFIQLLNEHGKVPGMAI